ncbi:MAG: homocysteine S-methyltransferase family protein [Christensenellales bacterium]|jgi:5-methyltetrahydrofolate--homocysteine methyltransferase
MVHRIRKEIFLLDGAMGTNLQLAGMPSGVCPESWALENPDQIARLHRAYADAGSDAVYCFSFGANEIRLGEYGLADKTEEINQKLAQLARSAVPENVLIGGSIGPMGCFVQPFGDMLFEDAVNVFKRQVRALTTGGVDFFAIETMMDIQEARAALLAVKETCDLPVFVCMTYERGHTLTGSDPVSALVTLQSLGADAVGMNCSTGPDAMLPLLAAMKPYAKVPLIAKPNAGLPQEKDGVIYYDLDASSFAAAGRALIEAGASILGGCCGTAPHYIEALAKSVQDCAITPCTGKGSLLSCVCGVAAPNTGDFLLIGERINPTGQQELQQDLLDEEYDTLLELADEQLEAGANLLDVNVGMAGIDEKKALASAVLQLSVYHRLPLCIDSADPDAMEAALRVYPGRALVNSVSCRQSQEKMLALCAKYGAMFIAMPIDDNGIAATAEARMALIRRITQQAEALGIPRGDIIVDALCMPAITAANAGEQTLRTIRQAVAEGYCTVVGLSNVSHGLPAREYINAAFLLTAMAHGLHMAIANPLSAHLTPLLHAYEAVSGKEGALARYTGAFGTHTK